MIQIMWTLIGLTVAWNTLEHSMDYFDMVESLARMNETERAQFCQTMVSRFPNLAKDLGNDLLLEEFFNQEQKERTYD